MKGKHRTSNFELRTSNDEPRTNIFDLEERLLEFAARIIRLSEALPNGRGANHVAGQILRSGTSPLPNHGEMQAAESLADFIHKLKICLKELRETHRWLRLIDRARWIRPDSKLHPLIVECDELVRIFVKSLETAQARQSGGSIVCEEASLRSMFDVQSSTFDVRPPETVVYPKPTRKPRAR